jgi:TPR repeat protein
MAKQNIALGRNTQGSLAVLQKAADNGEIEALAELGKISYKKDRFKEARKWFEKAAENKHPEALRYLGILHFLGQGMDINYKQASEWFEQAVRAGDLEASRYLRIVRQFK